MIVDPPEYPARKVTSRDVPSPPPVTAVIVGGPGSALGVPDAGDDAVPDPEAETPRKRTE